MTAAAAKASTPILRTAAGEPPLGPDGCSFRDDQGEMFWYDRDRSPMVRIGVLALHDGKWLSHPPGFHIGGILFDTREAALRYAIARTIRKARKYMRAKEGEGTHWNEGFAGRVIEWALALKPAGYVEVPKCTSEEISAYANPNNVLGVKKPKEEITDKVAAPILSAKGRAPTGAGDRWFFPGGGDGEWHIPEDDRLRGVDAQIGLIELNNGRWLARPEGLCIDYPSFPSRETALRSAIAKLIRRQRMLVRDRDRLPSMIGVQPEKGRAVIEWALALKPPNKSDGLCPVPPATLAVPTQTACETEGESAGVDLVGGATARRMSGSEYHGSLALGRTSQREDGASPGPSDPIVAALVAAHRARKAYPAGHTFSMTNPIVNGHMVTLGTCSCGESFSYAWGSYERMDAAIEAHWQKFDHLPDKVDGRGNPIQSSNSDAGGPPASCSPVPPVAPTGGTGALLEAAPIGAGSGEVSEPTSSHALTPAPESDPVREAGLGGGSLATGDDEFWDSPLIKAAIELAWRDDDGRGAHG